MYVRYVSKEYRELHNKTALANPTLAKGMLLVQFDDMTLFKQGEPPSLESSWAHGWHLLPRADFTFIKRPAS